MIRISAVVAKDFRTIATNIHRDVKIAVVVEIGCGQAAAGDGADEIGTKRIGNFLELTLAEVTEHQQRLFVRDFTVIEGHVVDHCAVGLQDVWPAVVIVVHELH